MRVFQDDHGDAEHDRHGPEVEVTSKRLRDAHRVSLIREQGTCEVVAQIAMGVVLQIRVQGAGHGLRWRRTDDDLDVPSGG